VTARLKWLAPASGLLLPAVALAVWWVASADSTSPYFPPLEENLDRFFETWSSEAFATYALPSLGRFAAGFALAVAIGVAVGTALGLSARARRDVAPITEFCRALPVTALIPAALLVFGPGTVMEVGLIAFSSVWPVLLNTIDGVRGVDSTLLETGRAYRLSRGQRLRLIVLPAALPQIAAGVQVSLAIALSVMVIANMFGGADGLGQFILEAQRTFDVPQMWAGILLLGLIGYVMTRLLDAVEGRVLGWHRGLRAASREI
jgi:sulfonate transport system permease protein